MADYKDIINGTLSSLKGIVKDVAGSETVTKLVDKVKEGAESTGVKDVYVQGLSRTRSYGRIAKLNLAINGENEELGRVFSEIGKLYFEQAKDDPQGFFAPLFAQASQLQDSIQAKQQEIAAMKAELAAMAESDIDVEIEEVVGEPVETRIDSFADIVDATAKDGAADPD
ncbi:MAG: hypothetical protein J5927_02385 [Oscillospiraceae bacterium]|nr:hypothetical protein [Oscillospiraceae bacterium]